MSDRRRAALRLTPLIGAGAALLIAALVGSPPATAAAHAAGAGSTPLVQPAEPAPRDDGPTTTPPPSTGYQKFAVGVQIKAGAWVPDGTTTAGSTVHIVETGPSVANDPGGELVTDCTTLLSTQQPGSTQTFCQFPDLVPNLARAPRNGVNQNFYYALPGDTVTLTQTSFEPHLVIDATPQTVPPASNDCDGFFCATQDEPVIFTDAGLPPTAHDDTASTSAGEPVLVDVLANDDTQGAPAQITLLGEEHPQAPARAHATHGTTQVVGTKIKYTPVTGFTGTASFQYQLATANGTSAATVQVQVAAGPSSSVTTTAATSTSPATSPVTTSSASVAPTNVSTSPPLAQTGADSGDLLPLGLGLLAAGGVATAAGLRRRGRGRHA